MSAPSSSAKSLGATTLRRAAGWLATGVTLVLAALAAAWLGAASALLVLAGGALLGTLVLAWRSLESVALTEEMTLEEALSLAAPRREEEQKASLLRALRDLDYERSVGKISEDDYAELTARYRAEAKALLERVDEALAEARAAAEAELEALLAAPGEAASSEVAR